MTNNHPDPLLISFLTLRKAVGLLGLSLPAVLLLGTCTISHCTRIQDSISHYYYTIMGDVFVGMLCAVALFLLSYKGYDRKDKIATNLAGIFALGVAFFPTSPNNDCYCSILSLPYNPLRITTHYVAAALFFITLSYISVFLFTQSSGYKTIQKSIRNKIYRVCGVVIIAAIVTIFIIQQTAANTALASYRPVFWLEWTALAAFGMSWLTKGEFLLKDKPLITPTRKSGPLF